MNHKDRFAGEFSLQYHRCQIISKFWINHETSRRLSAPEGSSQEREALQTRHEVARREKRGRISPIHNSKQRSSYGFHLYQCITQSRVAKFLHVQYGELDQVQIDLGCNSTVECSWKYKSHSSLLF